MPDNLLLQSQKNEVFVVIQASGLEPSTFDWQRWRSDHSKDIVVSRLVHAPTESYFQFDLLRGEHWCRFSPGKETMVEENYPGTWAMQMSYVRNWVANLKRESSAGDLWATVSSDQALAGTISDPSINQNLPFTKEERDRIASGLREIRAFIGSAATMSQATLSSIDERLEYLEQASERLGRKDWLNVAFSVVANIAVGAALAPDAARNLLHFAGAVFSWLAAGSPLLPNPLH